MSSDFIPLIYKDQKNNQFEDVLIEIQGEIKHTVEVNFDRMELGKLEYLSVSINKKKYRKRIVNCI